MATVQWNWSSDESCFPLASSDLTRRVQLTEPRLANARDSAWAVRSHRSRRACQRRQPVRPVDHFQIVSHGERQPGTQGTKDPVGFMGVVVCWNEAGLWHDGL